MNMNTYIYIYMILYHGMINIEPTIPASHSGEVPNVSLGGCPAAPLANHPQQRVRECRAAAGRDGETVRGAAVWSMEIPTGFPLMVYTICIFLSIPLSNRSF